MGNGLKIRFDSMITNEQIRQTVNDCTAAGHAVGMRDISYVLLCRHYEDKATAYRILYGLDADFNPEYAHTYDQTATIRYLRDYMELTLDMDSRSGRQKRGKRIPAEDDISFEENKAEIIRLIKQTKEALEDGKIEAKDALRIEADLRVKLNDKFAVQADNQEQIVYVFEKFNDICPYCNHEISRRPMSIEEAKERYNLIEREDKQR